MGYHCSEYKADPETGNFPKCVGFNIDLKKDTPDNNGGGDDKGNDGHVNDGGKDDGGDDSKGNDGHGNDDGKL